MTPLNKFTVSEVETNEIYRLKIYHHADIRALDADIICIIRNIIQDPTPNVLGRLNRTKPTNIKLFIKILLTNNQHWSLGPDELSTRKYHIIFEKL